MRSYPVDEVFTVLSGKIDVTNEDGSVVNVGPGQSCLLRKGWTGLFHTVEQTRNGVLQAGVRVAIPVAITLNNSFTWKPHSLEANS